MAQSIASTQLPLRKKTRWFPNLGFHAPVVLARDKQTIELRVFYPLPTQHDQEAHFTNDVYLFFPGSFGVTPETWSSSVFYRNSRVFSRLHAPALTLADLRNPTHPLNPIGLLEQRLYAFLEDYTIPGSSLTALAQMCGAELTDAIYQSFYELKNSIQALKDEQDISHVEYKLRRCCEDGFAALQALFRVSRQVQTFQGVVHPKLLPSLSFALEYGCAMLDERLAEMAVEIEQQEALRDGQGTAVRMWLTIANTLEQLNVWRREIGFVQPDSRESEYYSYRINLLKKEVQRSLYVHLRASKRDPFFANSAAMVAAGLAATWATLAQIPLFTGRWTSAEGMALFASAVGAYILKDRIKDLVRKRLTKRWINWDSDHFMEDDILSKVGLGSFTGRVRERMRWVEDGSLPSLVKKTRRTYRTVQGATTHLENVIHYRRELTFSAKKQAELPYGYGVQEIHRIALDDIVRRLDEPTDMICYYDDVNTEFRKKAAPRVYHLNIVQVSVDKVNGVQYKSRTRVVLNQKQILRVEPVLLEQEEIEVER